MSSIGAHVLRDGLMNVRGTLFNIWVPEVKNNHDIKVCIEHHGGTKEFSLSQTSEAEYWSVFVHASQGGIPENKYWFKIWRGKGYHEFADLASRKVEYIQKPNSLEINLASCKGFIIDYGYPWQIKNFSKKQEDLIIYELHFGSFASIKNAGQHLNRIKELNFTAIELLPTQAFSNEHLSAFGGYDPAYHFAPYPPYGTPTDLRNFVDRAHALGLAVIFDVQFNHFPFKGNCFWEYPNTKTGRGCFVSENQNKWGSEPNFSNKEVTNFFIQNLQMYIQEYKADGFRFDCPESIINFKINQIPSQFGKLFLQEVSHELSKVKDKKIHLIAEQEISKQCPDFRIAWYKSNQIHFTQDYHKTAQNLNAIAGVVLLKKLIALSAERLYINYLLGSHDEIYFAELFKNKPQEAKEQSIFGWCLNVVLRGIPMIFMGTEILQAEKWQGKPLNWEPTEESNDLQALVKDINLIRLNRDAIKTGTIVLLNTAAEEPIVAFLRYHNDEQVVVIVNFSEKPYPELMISEKENNLKLKDCEWNILLCSQDKKYGGMGYDKCIVSNHQQFKLTNLPKRSVTLVSPKISKFDM